MDKNGCEGQYNRVGVKQLCSTFVRFFAFAFHSNLPADFWTHLLKSILLKPNRITPFESTCMIC